MERYVQQATVSMHYHLAQNGRRPTNAATFVPRPFVDWDTELLTHLAVDMLHYNNTSHCEPNRGEVTKFVQLLREFKGFPSNLRALGILIPSL